MVSGRALAFLLVLVLANFFGCTVLLIPLYLLLAVSLTLYRRWADYVLAAWFHLSPALLELVFGIKVRVCGDLQKVEGPCIIILNHRTRLDWLFIWSYLIRLGDPLKFKIVLKETLKTVPIMGWGMQSANFIFLSRNWATDKKTLSDHLTYFTSRGYPIQLLFFPEGTDLSDRNREKSHHYAEKNGLPKFNHVLHPRVRGFTHCLQELRKGVAPPSVVNISIAYLGHIPQNESDILTGHWPDEIHIFAEIIPPSHLPIESEAVGEWLKHRWQEKEEILRNFYAERKFRVPYMKEMSFQWSWWKMVWAMVFWFSLIVGGIFCLIFFKLWWWFVLVSAFYTAISHLSPGMDRIIVSLHQMTHQAISSSNGYSQHHIY